MCGLSKHIHLLLHCGKPSSLSGISFLSIVGTQMRAFHWCAGGPQLLARPAVSWHRVVWEMWSLPKYNFILWLAIMGKLRTRDRLTFIPLDPACVFCRHGMESHGHLFFACVWSGGLWAKIKSWLRIGRRMTTLNSAIHGLSPQRCNMELRMRRVALAITIYLLWEERNRRIYEGKTREVDTVFIRFQILFYTVYYFHDTDQLKLQVGWSSLHGVLACMVSFSWCSQLVGP